MEENWLSILLKGLSTGFMTYAILTFIELSGIKGGINDMELVLGLSSGAWGAIGSALASIITIIGTVYVQHMKNKRENKAIKSDVRDARDVVINNVKSVSDDIKDVNNNIKIFDSNVEKSVVIPVSHIHEYSKETRDAVAYLVEEQHLKNKIKNNKKDEDASLIIKACTESLIDDKNRLMEEKIVLKKEIDELKVDNDNLFDRLREANNENRDLQNKIAELKHEINHIRCINNTKQSDEFEL